jgi:hypothetical protein
MGHNPCPLCGDQVSARFDTSSDWCVRCASGTLAEQDQLAADRQQLPQIIDTR